MKLTVASALIAAASANPFAPVSKNNAKSAYVGKLVNKATPIRKLDEDYPVDISSYSVKFDKCQFVKAYSDEMAENEEAGSVFGINRFAIFRLCPNNACDSCDYNYGEYLLDLDVYLETTVGYFKDWQDEMCNQCNECYNDDGNANRKLQAYNADCSTCVDECDKIENMADNGYVDATDFLECQLIYDADDDDQNALYARPICAANGEKIKIGVFSDEDCLFYDSEKEVDDYLMSEQGYQMKLSHALLKMTYQDTCISCMEAKEEDENGDGNDNEDADEVNELCEDLYDFAAKCESKHGFENGAANADGYENQLAQEELVCEFMNSLKSGTYDEEGEINVRGASYSLSGGTHTTGGQKFALCFFILGTFALAFYAAMLHSKLTKGASSAMTAGGGAMA